MIIKDGKWCKKHVLRGIKHLKEHPAEPKCTDIMEFGTYRGETLYLIENLCETHEVPYRIAFGFDSFEGLPEEQPGIPKHHVFRTGAFNDIPFTFPLINGKHVKCWFNQLNKAWIDKWDMKPAKFIHIDCDLYISALDALSFVFTYGLAGIGTVIAYDEFKSVEPMLAGGEAKAHMEMSQKFNVEFEEFFRNEYKDGVVCWQNCFVIKSFDKASTKFLE